VNALSRSAKISSNSARDTHSARSARSSTANRRDGVPLSFTGICALRSVRSLTVAESPELSSR
jgi:hypothetical protein